MARAAAGRKYALVMVGLPARGKSFTARKLVGYLSWLGYPTQVFNVGERRRETFGLHPSHEFFDSANREARVQREVLGFQVLREMLDWLESEGRVGIFDATNSTRTRRREVARRCEAAGVEVLFVEIQNRAPEIVAENIREVKLRSPDYEGVPEAEAMRDFQARIAHYEEVYEPLEEDEGSFVRIVDRGLQVLLNRVDGWLPGRILFFLANLQLSRRKIWLTRHGESQFNVASRIGGDPALSERGREFATRLAREVAGSFGPDDGLDLWTSTLRRTLETAAPIGLEPGTWRVLDEISAGVCEGMSYAELRERLPGEWEARNRDKLHYRYPRGESYDDVIQRVDRVIIELERSRHPVLVIAHRAVLRALYAYFVQLPRERVPFAEIPLHTVIELEPTAYGCIEERRVLGPEVADPG